MGTRYKSKSKIRPTRRGLKNVNNRKTKFKQNIKFSIIGTNANCLSTKQESLLYLIDRLQPSAILIQETMMRKIGQISLPGYQIFEKLRENNSGGGLLTAISDYLSPVLVSFEDDNLNILTVQVKISGCQLRIINAYGPQEHTTDNT